MTRAIPVILIAIFIASTFIVPAALVGTNSNITLQSPAVPAQIQRDARVAIYDEDNTTAPAESSASGFTNNVNELVTLLTGAGHEATLLTTQDILDHELITADYDVFIMVNNVPRESISKLVREFWLGGGGLLSFSKAFSYLSYESIIWPELWVDGYGILWGNLTCDVMNVTARHPTMKDYHINETVSERVSDWAVIASSVFDGSDVWNYITPLMTNLTEPNYITAFAMDSTLEGGRVVQLPGDGSSIPAAFESIIIDSVEWLKNYSDSCNLVYLDSYDFPLVEMLDAYGGKTDYNKAITTIMAMPPEKALSEFGDKILPCQEHCLNEIKAIESSLADNAIVLIDDNDMPAEGKARLAKAYLHEQGWFCLADGQQTMWMRSL